MIDLSKPTPPQTRPADQPLALGERPPVDPEAT
jgi:hypothetical protein